MIIKRILAIVTIVLVFGSIFLLRNKKHVSAVFPQPMIVLKDGDLIFQTSLSTQSKAIQLATKSPYSHCGIIYRKEKEYYVFEAIQPVKLTLLNDWIKRGKSGQFVIKRLKNSSAVINEANLNKMKAEGAELMGKDYDLTFKWSDDQMYCSELIWKVYQRGLNIKLAPLTSLSSFDLSDPIVKEIMYKRYGKNIPLNEPVISPDAIFNSKLLITITSNP